MRTSLAAVTALTGSLLLPFLILGSAQAVTNAPELKNVKSTTHIAHCNACPRWRRVGFVAAVAIWTAWAVATWVAWAIVWAVLPVVMSMVAHVRRPWFR